MLSQDIIDCLGRIVSHDGKNRYEGTLAYVTCTAPITHLLAYVVLLLRAGADPNGTDNNGDGVLHYLASKNGEQIGSIARVLLDAGAHLDRANNQGRTAADVWKQKKKRTHPDEEQATGGWSELPDWLKDEDAPMMQC